VRSPAVTGTLTADDYAGVLWFLVSEQAEVITGQMIRADGGLVMV
jgi:enoyl-[acyl-carrier-protein] reductase (NADH)